MTNVEIGRRVGKLEDTVNDHGSQLHEMKNQMTVFGLRLEHSQTLMSSKFEQVFAQGATHGEQLARVIERFDNAMAQGAEASADPEKTPAGRQLVKAISDMKVEAKATRDEARASRDWVLRASGGLAILLVLMTVFGPVIQQVLQVPQ